MFNRVIKHIKHPNGKGAHSNAVSPNENVDDANGKKGRRHLRVSKSYGDMSINVDRNVQPQPLRFRVPANDVNLYDQPRPFSVRVPESEAKVHVESRPFSSYVPENDAGSLVQPQPLSILVPSNAEPKESRATSRAASKVNSLEIDELTREIIAAKLKQANKASKTPKKANTKRAAKRDARAIVLARFKSLATKNPDFKSFLENYPEYLETMQFDELRESEYSRLDKLGHVYLDYTGGSLYPESLIHRHSEILINGVFGNPHSTNPTSSASTVYEEKVREDILEFFGANPDEYDVILTNNASGALKLVGESYPFSPSRKLLLTWDAHNSVNGIRNFAAAKGSKVTYVNVDVEDVRINKQMLKENLDKPGTENKNPGLFVLTGQSNVTGVKADLAWLRYARARGWDVLLDASALAPTTQIDLRKYPVDFMAISFYKMFGYPTGVGCLIMRKETESKLVRPWFGGGTVELVGIPSAFTNSVGHKRFEDGTLNYLSLSAVSLGLAFLRPLQKGLSDRINILVGYLLKELSALRHESTGRALVNLSGPKTTHLRGGTISFYLTDADGSSISHLFVEAMSKKRGISMRGGCLCNPGATSMGRGEARADDLSFVQHGMSVANFMTCFDEEFHLLLRISVGLATNWEDCAALLKFLKEFLDPAAYAQMKKEIGVIPIVALC